MTDANVAEILGHAGSPTRLFAGNQWIEAGNTGSDHPRFRAGGLPPTGWHYM